MLNWLPADASVLCRHGEDCMKGEKFEKNFKDERGNKNGINICQKIICNPAIVILVNYNN